MYHEPHYILHFIRTSKFQGEFVHGQANGRGVWYTDRGDIIQGEFRYARNIEFPCCKKLNERDLFSHFEFRAGKT